MKICPNIEMIPVLHGKELFAREVRRLCSENKFDCIAVDIPGIFQDYLAEAVDVLPLISALIAYEDDRYGDTDIDDTRYYLPIDPCDAMIEGIRQARQRRLPFHCVGASAPREQKPLPSLPDEYSIEKIGFDAYAALCIAATADVAIRPVESTETNCIGEKLSNLRLQYGNILFISHLRHFEAVKNNFLPSARFFERQQANPVPLEELEPDALFGSRGKFTIVSRLVNPDHLYFALGELPFITAKTQMERQDPFAAPVDLTDAVKELFRETRDNYFDDREEIVKLSPVRIQAALTYLRNLTVTSGRLIPSLFDIVEAAKGVGGNAYALRILKSAKYYPFLPIDCDDGGIVNVGIDRITMAGDDYPGAEREVFGAVNLFRDTETYWRTINIKPDPSELRKMKYRYSWNPYGCCSHLPEDIRLESFNSHARGKAMRVVTEHLARTEKFTTSVKDGIDIRETLRNWHTGGIYVKELPPVRGRLDTVIVIFDECHDDDYPQRHTWYAEHENESTLSFYATDMLGDMIGPGIGRCVYGGVAMLFPPRTVPDLFDVTEGMDVKNCAERLVAGSLLFSKEKNAAFIAAKPPSFRMRTMARRLKKHLVWIPLSTFSNETLNRLRRFHVLNGTNVRSWASRFIGDEA